jgi:predicted LPLAT superfamily acyltransferase
VGPYLLAATAGSPLIHVFNVREPGGHYHCYGFPPQRPFLPARKERDDYLRKCARAFALDLERVLQLDPLQWYNFFPFWEKPVPPASDLSLTAKPCPSNIG